MSDGGDAEALAALRPELECPICRDVPRGKIYQCDNAHVVCETCYRKLDGVISRKCPQGECKYKQPEPSRSLIAERMIERCNFEFACRHVDDGCVVRRAQAELGEHERACPFKRARCAHHANGCHVQMRLRDVVDHEKECPVRDVQCPAENCARTLAFISVEEHIRSNHENFFPDVGGATPSATSIRLLLRKTEMAAHNVTLRRTMWVAEDATRFVRAVQKIAGLWYVWVWHVGGPSAARKWVAEIEVTKDKRPKLRYEVDVNAIDVTSANLPDHGHYLLLSDQQMKSLISENLSAKERNEQGYDGELSLGFKVTRVEQLINVPTETIQVPARCYPGNIQVSVSRVLQPQHPLYAPLYHQPPPLPLPPRFQPPQPTAAASFQAPQPPLAIGRLMPPPLQQQPPPPQQQMLRLIQLQQPPSVRGSVASAPPPPRILQTLQMPYRVLAGGGVGRSASDVAAAAGDGGAPAESAPRILQQPQTLEMQTLQMQNATEQNTRPAVHRVEEIE